MTPNCVNRISVSEQSQSVVIQKEVLSRFRKWFIKVASGYQVQKSRIESEFAKLYTPLMLDKMIVEYLQNMKRKSPVLMKLASISEKEADEALKHI